MKQEKSWHELIGRMVEVVGGPLAGARGVLQDVTSHATVAYRDGNSKEILYFKCITSDLIPQLTDNEKLKQ